MPIVRNVVRTLTAGALVIVGTGVAGAFLAAPALGAQGAPAARALAQSRQLPAAGTASTSGLAIAIDSISPRYATTATATIEVKGTITNDTGRPLSGVQVQLSTSPYVFSSRSSMEGYAAGGPGISLLPTGQPWAASARLHSGSTMSWAASFPASQAGYAEFGVYPIDAQVLLADGVTQGDTRTFLPFYPGSGTGAPQKLDIAWIWPLIDTPQQGACPQDLASNELAASLARGGRLNGLLAAGLRYSAASRLTWAVDPALLSDASVMTGRYKVGGNAGCTGTTAMPASAAAQAWLSHLGSQAARDPAMFLTGYGDPDVSALAHAGLGKDLAQSQAAGNAEARKVLHRPFGKGAAIAWPAEGEADVSVLTTLAQQCGVRTAVLASDEMPANSYEDDATARLTTGVGTPMTVLLADSELTGLLGSATEASPAGTQFAVTQEFLAQTAMIVGQAPNTQRTVVVAPPSRWNPSQSEAAALLSLASAPWLQPVPLASLSSRKPVVQHVGLAGAKNAPLQLGPSYLDEVKSVEQQKDIYSSLLSQPGEGIVNELDSAVAVTESSAWRGTASRGGRTALSELTSYFADSERRIRIVSANKVLLGGTSGATPVSVSNDLTVAVVVKVHATVMPGSQLSVSSPDPIVRIPANQTVTVRLDVRSASLGSALLQLQLLTKSGVPLAGPPQSLSVESTRYGRTLLILIAAALGVLVLTSVTRWVRRWLRDGGSGHHVSGRHGGEDNVRDGDAREDRASEGSALHGSALRDSTSEGSGSTAGSGSGGTG
jgi:hypothetical protein